MIPRLALIAAAGLSLVACSRPAERPANVLLVVLDTTRADSVSFEGGTTPNLGLIARDGVVFTKARSTSAWTVPSHGSLFTGLYPSAHGAHHETQLLSDEATTLAEILSPTHDTAGFSENVHIGNKKGFAQGFAHFEETWRGGSEDRPMPTIERAIRWLRGRDPGRPFFLFVNLMDAHLPYRPPDDRARELLPQGVASDRVERLKRFSESEARRFVTGDLTLPPEDLEVLRALYRAEVSWADTRVGRILAELGDTVDDTLIVVVGDHGENLGEHGLLEHQLCLYETLLRVPLVVRHPGSFDGGVRRDDPVQLVDLFPTVLDVVGVAADQRPAAEGRSLLETASLDGRAVIAEYMRPLRQRRLFEAASPDFDFDRYDRRLQSIQIGRWKLIRTDRGETELYDLESDPGEIENLAGERRDEAARLAARLDEWARGRTVITGDGPQLDEEEIRALKALGYL